MSHMFASASSFNQDLSNWNVSNVTSMQSMFIAATLSQSNYEATLNGWANQQVQQGVIFDGGDSQFCDFTGRNTLINDHNWVITDGGQAEECPVSFDVSYTLTEIDINVSFDIVKSLLEYIITGVSSFIE
jgi:surface protein